MEKNLVFNFKTDISSVIIPKTLNNPFEVHIPEIVKIAVNEFQEFISAESQNWGHDFGLQKGKMFGLLIVQKSDSSFGYLGTVSGKLSGNTICKNFVPSVLDESLDDFFLTKGMTELTEVSNTIKRSQNPTEIAELSEYRKNKSFALQQRLFQNYLFLNSLGIEQNVLQIFEHYSQRNPPSAAGECAAPKLLQYAFKHHLKPIALAEFWWGNTPKNKDRKHKNFYPACKDKCQPILEFMLNDRNLYQEASIGLK